MPKVIKECGQKGVKCAVVFSSGFGEIKNGVKLEEESDRATNKYHVRIIALTQMAS